VVVHDHRYASRGLNEGVRLRGRDPPGHLGGCERDELEGDDARGAVGAVDLRAGGGVGGDRIADDQPGGRRGQIGGSGHDEIVLNGGLIGSVLDRVSR
jgi:hypothetical protein